MPTPGKDAPPSPLATIASLEAAKNVANEAFVKKQFDEATRLYVGLARSALLLVAKPKDDFNDNSKNIHQLLITVLVNLLAVRLAIEDKGEDSPPSHTLDEYIQIGSWVLLQDELQKTMCNEPHNHTLKALLWGEWRVDALSHWLMVEPQHSAAVNNSASHVVPGQKLLKTLVSDLVMFPSGILECLTPVILKARFRLARLHRIRAERFQRDAVALIASIHPQSRKPKNYVHHQQQQLIRTAQAITDHFAEAVAICSTFDHHGIDHTPEHNNHNDDETLSRMQLELLQLGDVIRRQMIATPSASSSTTTTTAKVNCTEQFHSGVAIVKQFHAPATELPATTVPTLLPTPQNRRPLVRHGTGLVAIRPLVAGEVVLCEPFPLMEARGGGGTAASAQDAYEHRFVAAVEGMMALWSRVQTFSSSSASNSSSSHLSTTGLSDVTKILRILSLHARDESAGESDGVVDDDDSDIILERGCDVWHHNAMRIGDDIDFRIKGSSSEAFAGGSDTSSWEGGSAVYHVGSRLNHSCRPNAICCFLTPVNNDIPSTTAEGSGCWTLAFNGSLTVRLLRDVDAGEEILISYCPIIESIESKKRHCRSFVCRCDMCSGEFPSPLSLEENLRVPRHENSDCEDSGGVVAVEAVRCALCGANEVFAFLEDATVGLVTDRSDNSRGHRGACRGAVSLSEAALGATRSVEQKLDQILSSFVKQQSTSVNPAEERSSCLHQLITLEACSSVLGPRHRLRLRILQEALALGVATSLTEEDSFALTRAARSCLAMASSLCPLHWPLLTGLQMHLVFCIGRHYVGQHTATTDEDEVGSDDGETAEATIPALWRDDESVVDAEEVKHLVSISLLDHTIQYWGKRAADSRPGDNIGSVRACFWDRYQSELLSIGITSVNDLNEMMSGVSGEEAELTP